MQELGTFQLELDDLEDTLYPPLMGETEAIKIADQIGEWYNLHPQQMQFYLDLIVWHGVEYARNYYQVCKNPSSIQAFHTKK